VQDFRNYDLGKGDTPKVYDKVITCHFGSGYEDGYYSGYIGGFADYMKQICIIILNEEKNGVISITAPAVCLRKV
jgi:uncharacterized protein YifN (PemK superfamily)